MRITFFKTGKPRVFNYIPRYYDEQKEEFKEREKRIKKELGINRETEGYRSRLTRGVMTGKLLSKRQRNRSSVIRLMIIIAILVLLVLFLLRDTTILNKVID